MKSQIDYKNNYTEMVDINGTPILKDSLLKHKEHVKNIQKIVISKYERIDFGTYIFNKPIISLIFATGFRKNPCEVEVVTVEQTILSVFEEDAILRIEENLND